MMYPKNKPKKPLGLLFITLLLLYSCSDVFNSKDYTVKKVKASPSLDLPLVSGDLIINDILSKAGESNIKVYSGGTYDGVAYLLYDQTLKTQGINDLLQFPNKGFSTSISIPAGTLPATASPIQYTTQNTTLDFGFSPQKLTELKFKTTTVDISVAFTPSLPASNTFEIQIKLPNFTYNGAPFVKKVSAGTVIPPFQLQDYVATLANNTFPMEITIIEKPHTSPVTITNPTVAKINLNFTTIDFKYVKGFFGDQSLFSIPAETIDFTAFGNSLAKANVSFADPKLSFSVSNDYGVPTKITFNPLEVRKTGSLPLAVQLNPASPVSINAPTQLGTSASTSIAIANAKQVIDYAPNQLYYKISARINEGLTSGNNFCADTSKIRVNFKAEVPLYGKATGIVMSDTFAIDLSDAKNSNIESAALLAKINNQIPLDANIQLYLADGNSIIYDSLLATADTGIVKASTVDSKGELQTPGTTNKEIPLVKEKLTKIFDAKRMIVKVKLNTSKDANGNLVDVKFKTAYKMNVIFGLKAKLNLDYDL